MSGKLTRKQRAELQSQQHKSVSPETVVTPKKKAAPIKIALKENPLVRRLNIILLILAVGVYCNTLVNQYALDDYGVILENTTTKQGASATFKILGSSYREGMMGGDNTLYRPLSKVMFAWEWSLSEQSPGLSHFVNVCLFALSIVLLFRMLRRYMKENIIVPFVAAAIFAVHPIHTEVVANIKGRDDILCFLFFVVTALYVHRYTLVQDTKFLVIAGVSFLLCMLSKESAITFVAVIPLLLYFFTNSSRETYFKVSGVVAGVALLFLFIRWIVLSGGGMSPVPMVDNYIAGIDGFVAQRATAIAIGGLYLLKLVVPFGLVSDASVSQMPVYGFGSWEFLVSLVVFLAAAGFAIMKFKSKHPVSFAILYFFITFSVVSNIPFILGTNYGERLLYAPSLGMCIIFAWLLHRAFLSEENVSGTVGDFFRSQQKTVISLGVIAIAYSGVSVMRNAVWYDNETLYGTDMQISEKSCKMHYFYANHITQKEYLDQFAVGSAERSHIIDTAIVEFRNAISLCPVYTDPMQKLAEMYYDKKQLDSADLYYNRAIRLNPTSAIYRNNYGRMLFATGRLFEAQYQFECAIRCNMGYSTAYNNLAGTYGTQASQLINKAQKYPWLRADLEQKAMALFQKSIDMSLKSIAYDPYFISAYETTAMTYSSIQNPAKAQEYAGTAQQLKTSGQGHY